MAQIIAPLVTKDPNLAMPLAIFRVPYSTAPVEITVETFGGDTLDQVVQTAGLPVQLQLVQTNPSPGIYKMVFYADKTSTEIPVGTTSFGYQLTDTSGNISVLSFDVICAYNSWYNFLLFINDAPLTISEASVQAGLQQTQLKGSIIVDAPTPNTTVKLFNNSGIDCNVVNVGLAPSVTMTIQKVN